MHQQYFKHFQLAAFSPYEALTFKRFFVCLNDFNNTILYQNEGEETKSQEHQHPCPILLEFRHSSPPFCKNDQKTWVRACETKYIDQRLCIFLMQILKAVNLLTVNWSEHFFRWGYFQICSGNNISSLLYPCEVIHLIKKSVISPYVQE